MQQERAKWGLTKESNKMERNLLGSSNTVLTALRNGLVTLSLTSHRGRYSREGARAQAVLQASHLSMQA